MNISKILDRPKIVSELRQLLTYLSQKEFEIIHKRYGLDGKEPETLAAVGDKMNLTRERIRQIQNTAIKKLQRAVKSSDLIYLNEFISDLLEANGGVLVESELIKQIKDFFKDDLKLIHNELLLIAELDNDIIHEHNKVDHKPHYRFKSIKLSQIKEASYHAIKRLKAAQNLLNKTDLCAYISTKLPNEYTMRSENTIVGCLVLDRRLRPHGDMFSLLAWRHVNPRTLFDKIAYIFNETNKPLHFREIADKLEVYSFRKAGASIQAIHNELISNPMFVLIGRGTYALKDWGYQEGTVSDVIESILAEEGPLSLNDLTSKVLQRRKVKEVTVQVNLNSKKDVFQKNQNGLYELIA